jgi:hypothetical protein
MRPLALAQVLMAELALVMAPAQARASESEQPWVQVPVRGQVRGQVQASEPEPALVLAKALGPVSE